MFLRVFFANQKRHSHFAKIILQLYSNNPQNRAYFAAYTLQPLIGNFAKKRPMTKRPKASLSLLSLIMGASFSVISARAQTPSDSLQVYAGPQTATPGQDISVTIEMTDVDGKSSHDETVQLTYISDGVSTSLSGKVSQGLVSFDIPAQRRAGTMTFIANADDLISNQTVVMVVAGEPIGFKFNVEPSRNANLVDLTTDVISDAFGNPVSDQTLISLDWIDQSGVKQSEFVQLLNGRMTYVSICPDAYAAPLKIRAVLKNVEVFSSELSDLCAARKERA